MNIQLFLFLFNIVCIFTTNAEPLVKISQGSLRGNVEATRYGRNYSAFLGIPYAKPPTGNLRFKNPVAAGGWSGIQSAQKFGNVCPQNDNGVIIGKENCLFLNVYTPVLNFQTPVPENKLLPVMVWIHGGSFLIGSSDMYGAGYLLQKDVILVTINYRLGVLGFLTTSDSLASGNFGMKDQVLALKWVKKNIRSFGGNPNKVTLFGESAGGIAVNLHAISKASNGLFQKYIIQSGTVLGPTYREKNEIEVNVKELARSLNCPINTSRAILDCLRRVNFEEFAKRSSPGEMIIKYGYFLWVPTIEPDTEGAFLTEKPIDSLNNNRMKDLPFISGTVTDEGLSFTSLSYSNFLVRVVMRINVHKIIAYLAKIYNQSYNKFFGDLNKFYFNNWYFLTFGDEYLKRMTKFFGDAAFFYPQIKLLEKVTPNMRNKNYFYSFGYRGALSNTQLSGDKRNLGVSHGDDILYLFPITYRTFITRNSNFTNNDERISKIVVDFWTSFATNGKPTSNELTDPNLWQPYSTTTSAHIQIGNIRNNTDTRISMSDDYFTDRMNHWKQNVPL